MLPKTVRMRRRAEFVQVTRLGKHIVTPHFVLQFQSEQMEIIPNNTNNYALGVTASRKIGGAVQRNRAKRRLRALLKNSFLQKFHIPKQDKPYRQEKPYRIVLVARRKCVNAKFDSLQESLKSALRIPCEYLGLELNAKYLATKHK